MTQTPQQPEPLYDRWSQVKKKSKLSRVWLAKWYAYGEKANMEKDCSILSTVCDDNDKLGFPA